MPAAKRPVVNRWQRWGHRGGCLRLWALYAGRDRIDSMLAPTGPAGCGWRLPPVTCTVCRKARCGREPQSTMARWSAPGRARALCCGWADGSAVEVNERSELFRQRGLERAGLFTCNVGDVIVQAAKQRHGRLRVQTRDSIASVKGTIFAVSTGMSGSLVTVVEGSVSGHTAWHGKTF